MLLGSAPPWIRSAAKTCIASFYDLFDLYVFSLQYYEAGGVISPDKIKKGASADIKYEIKPIGDGFGIFLNGRQTDPHSLEKEFLKAARSRLSEVRLTVRKMDPDMP